MECGLDMRHTLNYAYCSLVEHRAYNFCACIDLV